MSKLANLSSTIETARKILGKKDSLAWQVFNLVNGKRKSSEIAEILRKQESNVSVKLRFLEDKGVIEESSKIVNAIIYKKLPELKNLKHNSRKFVATSNTLESTSEQNSTTFDVQTGRQSNTITDKVIEIGVKHGIANIDQNWVDSLVILNFIETASTKFLMDHGMDEPTVKNMKWEQKFTQMGNILFQEASAAKVTIRTATTTFFKNYRSVRNEQDHIAHLPASKIHKTDVELLNKNLIMLIKIAFDEHKKYCPHV